MKFSVFPSVQRLVQPKSTFAQFRQTAVQKPVQVRGLPIAVEASKRLAEPAPKTPLEQPPGRSDELWKHTCFEVFVRTPDGYVEYNLSPSSRWATYRFDGYREGMREADEVATVLGMDFASDMGALEANIELPPGAEMLALSAVIEAEDGQKSYWALAHPSDKPDFHHPQSFVLELP